jgi:hypothetical protein
MCTALPPDNNTRLAACGQAWSRADQTSRRRYRDYRLAERIKTDAAAFFLQCMQAIGVHALLLDDVAPSPSSSPD